MKYLKFLVFFLIFHFWVFVSSPVYAADFETLYDVDYKVLETQGGLLTQVAFKISIKNLRSDVYVNKFSIAFPKSFTISDLALSDDRGRVTPQIESDETKTKIEMEFNNPNIGKDTVNNFYLSFNQANLFKVNGNVWEVILPVIENKDNATYTARIILPDNGDKKISIAKPAPNSINGREIVWINPPTRTIYAVFGEKQKYRVNLAYHLKNNNLTPVFTEVAFPPDTLYQKIYINSLSAKPAKVYKDQDGNMLASYFLGPRERKTINADFTVEVFAIPREEVLPWIRQEFKKQKEYLLSAQKYWEIESIDKISNLNDVGGVYSYVTSTLSYSYERVTTNNIRLGAEKILQNPGIAVCMEFTDLFVAASREKGIYAREIEGYGASSDPFFRPLSLSSDVLHAWPEFYDEVAELWRPIDPTWENTSGIDYFTSFDLNHVVFAIHGKKPDYPLPAGMYKIENSKDIEVTAIDDGVREERKVGITDTQINTNIADNVTYKGKFSIVNLGNVYVWDLPVEIDATGLKVSNPKSKIVSLAPYEKKEVNFDFKVDLDGRNKEPNMKILVQGDQVGEYKITVVPYLLDIGLKVGGGLIIAIGVFLVVRRLRR